MCQNWKKKSQYEGPRFFVQHNSVTKTVNTNLLGGNDLFKRLLINFWNVCCFYHAERKSFPYRMFSFHFLLKRSQTFLKKLHFSFIICTALLTSHILTFLKSWILIFIETSVFILIMKSFCLLFVEEERKQYFQRINKFFLLDQYGLFHNFNSSFQLYFHKEFIKIADI